MTPPAGTVLGGTGGVWRVRMDDGADVEASMRGRLKKSDYGRREGGAMRRDTVEAADRVLKLAVGDRVTVERDERDDAWAITGIHPRRSQLARRAPGGGHGERIVAANVDQVVVVFAAAKPEPHPRMLDRFLVIAEANALAARVVINKVELVGEEAARERFAAYERAGYPVHYTSAKADLGLAELHDTLAGRVSVLTGPSGVGKSSLVNALFPGVDLRVGEISESVNKGRHTTVGGHAHPLPVPGPGRRRRAARRCRTGRPPPRSRTRPRPHRHHGQGPLGRHRLALDGRLRPGDGRVPARQPAHGDGRPDGRAPERARPRTVPTAAVHVARPPSDSKAPP